MAKRVFTYLKFVRFKDLVQWDLKRYTNKSIKSKYVIAKLGLHIIEEREKYDISEVNKQYGILGVNNQTGIFDAYIEDGSKIKQKYKKMEVGWIAYNPYRINVGSIGIKKQKHINEYISPAYVVFRCRQTLYPDYLFLTMKTSLYNKLIRDNTTGSVRQNLSFNTLKDLPIPMPNYIEQQSLVASYNNKIQQADALEKQTGQIKEDIENYLLTELGIRQEHNGYKLTESAVDIACEPQVEYVISNHQNAEISDAYHWGNVIKKEYKYLKFVRFKDIERWDCYNSESSFKNKLKESSYPIVEIGQVFDFIQRRWDKKGSKFNYVEIGAVDPLKGILYAEEMQTSKAPSRATQKIKTGDLIIGTTRPYLKKFAIVEKKYDDCVCSSGFQVIAPRKTYNLSYLYEYLKSSVAISQFELFMSGALYPAISNKDLKKILIPLPPIDIQNSIVEHINEQKEQIKQMKQQAEILRKEALVEFEKEIFE